MTAEMVKVRSAVRSAEDTGSWPGWARPQLRHAVRLATRVQSRAQRIALAPELYRLWFNPIAGDQEDSVRPRPLAGIYRSAHAGTSVRLRRDGLTTVDRHDVIGPDGWWRTWGDAWRPGHSRNVTVRLVMSPRAHLMDRFVSVVSAALIGETTPWLLACPTDSRRLRRVGAAVLHVADPSLLNEPLVAALRPLLLPVAPPLCLPLRPGIAVADNPDNGLSFGEHRCHLIALALRAGSPQAPLRSIADVFAAHGIDPSRPHESHR